MPDQQTHRFLWKDLNPVKKPEEHMLEVVSFGDKPAATIFQLALRKTADLATNIRQRIWMISSAALVQ